MGFPDVQTEGYLLGVALYFKFIGMVTTAKKTTAGLEIFDSN